MWNFSKKTKRPAGPKMEAAAQKIAGSIVRRQLRIARYLERKTQYWNRTSKLLALFLFCLLFGGFSLWLLISAFFN